MNLSVGLKCESDGEPEPFKALTVDPPFFLTCELSFDNPALATGEGGGV